MFSFFRKKPAAQNPASPAFSGTFKTKVDQYWAWFSSQAPRFKDAIDSGRCNDLVNETSSALEQVFGKMSWCYGPGKEKGRHALSLSPEGNRGRQLLAGYWLRRAPEIPGWDFYPAKQANPQPGDIRCEINGVPCAIADTLVEPAVDEANQKVDITMWFPRHAELGEQARMHAAFIMLDEVLGEYGTENWIGQIMFAAARPVNAIPFADLPKFLLDLGSARGWEKHDPCDRWCIYQMPDVSGSFIRSDQHVGNTCYEDLVSDYFEHAGTGTDLMPGSGAECVFLRMPGSHFPKGREMAVRGEIEDKLEPILESDGLGIRIGGGMSHQFGYVDFLLFDGHNSRQKLLGALQGAGAPAGTTLHSWTGKNKAG